MREASITCALLLSACTLEAGTGFATIESAAIEGRLEDNPLVTADGHTLTFDALTLTVGHVVLEGAAGQGLPAEPTHCHGDDCDGESAEGGDAPVAVVEAHFEASLDVLAGDRLAAEEFEPSSELPLATIERVRIELEALRVEGSVAGGALAEPVPIAVDAAGPLDLIALAERTIDRDHGEAIRLEVELEVGPETFEHVDLAAAGGADLVEALLSAQVHVSFDGAHP